MGLQDIRERLENKGRKFRDEPKATLTDHWGFLAASTIFLFALYIRYMPVQGMKYFQALDPYWIFRQSQHLALEGNIPAVDFMRYFPYNAPFNVFNNGNIIFPALMYWMGPFLVFGSFLEWAQFYPALMGALGVFVTYFLGKELYDKSAGVAAAFFLATIPGVLHRTSAGFFEKEPIGSFFMVVSLYFFTRAWKEKNQVLGILSGLALGAFSISWGGSQFLWLLYPLVVLVMMFINEDIESLVAAYTPVVIVAGGFAAIVNPGKFSITSSTLMGNVGLLAFLWSRYLVEEFKLIKKDYIPYYTPATSAFGLIMLMLSPLYSDFLENIFFSLIGKVTQSGGGVIAGTVAENAPAGLNQLISQLGAVTASNVAGSLTGTMAVLRPFTSLLSVLGTLNGAWPLAIVGVVFAGTYVLAMILRKLDLIEKEVEAGTYYSFMVGVLFVWILGFASFFQTNNPISILRAISAPVLLTVSGIVIIIATNQEKDFSIEYKWYQILPLLWALSGILGAVSKSRLIFLAAFPTAFMAGYAFSRAVKKLNSMDTDKVSYLGLGSAVIVLDIVLAVITASILGIQLLLAVGVVAALNGIAYYLLEDLELSDKITELDLKYPFIGAVIALTLVVNLAAGVANAQSLGGSPNPLWEENLDWMEQNTEKGDVVLSWWDYGYWFESIGRRAAIADGGNNRYYTNSEKINYPLAEFLTSSNPENHTEFLEKHSVDYIVLDQSMIGKYSAVSQIANRDNTEFNSMNTLQTSRNIQESLSRDSNNNTVVQFQGRGVGLYIPINITGSSFEISEETAPTFEARGRTRLDCALTPEGRIEYDVESQTDYCAAINPYYSLERAIGSAQAGRPTAARGILVPKEISRSTLVRLYLMDGHGMDMVEKVDGGDTGEFIKMWEVTATE
ncbi:MAG: asparagine N-glycosylation enzyme membrane subunit Stt3 [Candidatus Nanohaloarchaea archaeon]|jgi:asparagine N-glycosylation enzyme membrane subunit Stt3